MNITNQQEAEKFIFSYLEQNPKILPLIKKRFFARKKQALPLVDEETEQRIGEALANIKAGNYVTLSSPAEIDTYFDSLDKEDACTA